MARFSLSDKSVLFIGSNILRTPLLMLWGMLLVRYLDKYEYGTFQQITILGGMMDTLILMGLHQGLFYFIPRASDLDSRKGIIIQNFFLVILIGVVVSIGVYLLGPVFAHAFNNPLLGTYVGIYSLFFIFDTPVMISGAIFLSTDKVHLASLTNISSTVFLILATILPRVLGYSFESMLKCILVFYIIKFVCFGGYILSLPGSIRKAFNLRGIKEQFKYSLPLGLSALPDAFRRQLDKFVISSFYSPDQFAVYSRGAFELPFVSRVTYSLNQVLLPKYVQGYESGDYKKMLYLWNEAIRRVALLFFPLFIFTFIFADKIITLLYTGAYKDSTLVFRIYLCLFPFRVVGYRVILRAMGDTKRILIGTIISLAMNIGLNIAFANSLGFYGPALAAVLSEIAGIIYLFFSMKKILNYPLRDLLPWRSLFSTFIVSIAIGIALLPLIWVNWSKFIVLVASSLLFLVVYIGIMKKAKLLSDKDWDLIIRWATLRVIR